MSYQYTSSSHNSAAMDMSHSTYMSSYPPPTSSSMEVRPLQQPAVHPAPPLPAQLPAPLLPPSAYPTPVTHIPLAKRRESLSKALKLRRSHSTPNVRPQGMNETDDDSLGLSGEKKRNRLGYARTNMACGNCRKRKIRCQPVKDDGRCSQCIRLKKECQFFPVHEQPPVQLGARTGPGSLPKAMLASAATSPPIAPGHPSDVQAHQPFHKATMPASHDMRPPAIRSDAYLHDPKLPPGASNGRLYSYSQGIGNWASSETSTSSAKPGDMNTSWRNYPPEPPVAPGFAPYPLPPPQTSTAWATSPLEATVGIEATSRPDDTWSPYQPPTRSMSFSGEHSEQYAASSRPYDRKASVASDIYHPTSLESMPSSYTTWQQPYQPWYAEGGQPVSSGAENPSQVDAAMYYGR
ncbi:hypothetical protein F5Y19DRAFT_475434 [Xylariaceae sp. FL1651]|nr:hypothetical protein F5Y19DRAFT_475434 [Xylariaceae sp. FL1651]